MQGLGKRSLKACQNEHYEKGKKTCRPKRSDEKLVWLPTTVCTSFHLILDPYKLSHKIFFPWKWSLVNAKLKKQTGPEKLAKEEKEKAKVDTAVCFIAFKPKNYWEEMEPKFPFGIFRPEKQDYLFGCSISPGNLPLERPQKSCSICFPTGFSRNFF